MLVKTPVVRIDIAGGSVSAIAELCSQWHRIVVHRRLNQLTGPVGPFVNSW